MAATPSVPAPSAVEQASAQEAGRTGLPAGLRAGVERLSGQSLGHVRVHRNSAKPAQLGAHAFAQGGDIHLAPGQERFLPHEAWHAAQQAQGRVRPTARAGDIAVNDDPALEREADRMGAAALHPAAGPPAGPGRGPERARTLQRRVIIKAPPRDYGNLPELVGLVHRSILSVAAEHRGEPFYDRVAVDIAFFEQIVRELFAKDPVYGKMLDFTDEIVRVGLAKAHFNPANYSKEDWALLHRMETQSFRRFIEAKEGTPKDSVVGAHYEGTGSKYNPKDFGDKSGKHSWRGNEEWIVYVVRKFPKLVLTDLPLSEANVFRGLRESGAEKTEGKKDTRAFSAYAREIAALLHEGYLPISANTLGPALGGKVSALTLVKDSILPPTVRMSIEARFKISRGAAVWIAKGQSFVGIGKGLSEAERVHAALSFFETAGIPTLLTAPASLPKIEEKAHRPLRWARTELQPPDKDKEEQLKLQRKKEEERSAKSEELTLKFERVDPSNLVLKKDDLVQLIRKAYADAKIEKPWARYVNSGVLKSLLKDAISQGVVSDKMSQSKLKEFIKENLDRIWHA